MLVIFRTSDIICGAQSRDPFVKQDIRDFQMMTEHVTSSTGPTYAPV